MSAPPAPGWHLTRGVTAPGAGSTAYAITVETTDFGSIVLCLFSALWIANIGFSSSGTTATAAAARL